jgi:hypothetical protein
MFRIKTETVILITPLEYRNFSRCSRILRRMNKKKGSKAPSTHVCAWKSN